MADEQYDGRVRIDTELDNSGFEKGSDQLKASVSGLARAINGITGSMASFFGKRWKMPEPELPEKEEMELPQPDPVKPEVDTAALDAGTKQVHKDMAQITRDVGADLPEPKPVEPELDSSEFDKQASKMQSSISRIVGEIDRMVSTSSQGFRSTTAVLTFNNKLDLTAEKIAEAREQLAEFARQQIPTDRYEETTKSIEKAEAALLKLYDRRDQMADLGVDENSKQWQKLELQIAAAEEEVERYEMAADRMRETGKAFVDPAATEQYAAMREQIEQAEQDIQTNAGLIRQEQLEQARLNVLIAQEKVAHAGNTVSRQIALRQLRDAQNELAAVAQKSVTPAPDPSAPGAWQRFGQTVKGAVSGAAGALKNLGSIASKATSGVKSVARKVTSFFSGLKKQSSSGLDGLLKKFTGIKRMLVTRIKRTFISFLFQQITESFKELAKFDSRFDQSVSNLRNRTSELGANAMAAFGGLLRQIEPIITKVIDAASTAVTRLNAVLTSLRGESTMQVAKRRTESYADSLRDAAKAAKEDQKAQEKLNATLTSIDEIHKLDAPKDDTADIDAGTDAEKTIYENVPVVSILNNMSDFGRQIAQRIIDGIKNGDWRDAGRAISEGLNAAIAKLDEKLLAIRPKAEKAAENIADLLNGMVEEFDGYALGKTIADGLNLALGTANAFLKRFDFYEFGATIGDGITGAVQNFEWETAGEVLGNSINGIVNTARGIFEHTDWRGIGSGFGRGLNTTIETIDWTNAAETLSLGIKSILNTISSFLEETDWQNFGAKVYEFLTNVDWGGIANALFEGAGAALGALGGFLWGLIKSAMDDIKNWWYDNAYENGEFSISGLLAGIGKALVNIGTWLINNVWVPFRDGLRKAFGLDEETSKLIELGDDAIAGFIDGMAQKMAKAYIWIKEKIFDPFVKGFKTVFGIASPAKKMKPYGGYVGEGILEGIKSVFTDVADWVKTNILEPFKRGFETAFSVIGQKANALFESGKSIAEGIKSGISGGWKSITTLLGQKKDEMRRDSAELADSAVSGFNDSDKFKKAGQNVVSGVTSGIDKDSLKRVGQSAADEVAEALKSGDYYGAGKSADEKFGDGVWDGYDEHIKGDVEKRAKAAAETFRSGDFYGAGQGADEDFGDGVWDGYDEHIKGDVEKRAQQAAETFANNEGYYAAGHSALESYISGMTDYVEEHGQGTAALEAALSARRQQQSWKEFYGPMAETASTIRTIAKDVKTIDNVEIKVDTDTIRTIAKDVEAIGSTKLDINADSAVSKLDVVADKLGTIAATFREIGRLFTDLTAVPVPAVVTGAIAPAQTRVADDDRRADGVTANLLERLITRIEELEEMVASRPIRLESTLKMDEREIAKATADYNAGGNRVTNGNGGASSW